VSKRSRRARSASQPASQPGNRPVNKPATPSGTPSATPTATAAEATASGASTSRPATTRPTGVRAGRRERARPYAQQKTFFERYRILIIGLVGVAAVALLAVWAFNSASAAAFTCSTEWVPEPTASPAPGASPQPGYHQEGMGNTHVGPGTNIPADVTYTYCPPASGNHFNRSGAGPIKPGFYGADGVPLPQGWVHNLEHGALVVLYRGDPGDPGLTPEAQQQMQDFFSGLGPSPVCGFPPTQEGAGVVIARFDQMATPFAALVWERVLPLDTFDEAAISEFWDVWGERTNPEQLCTPPSPAPASPAPS